MLNETNTQYKSRISTEIPMVVTQQDKEAIGYEIWLAAIFTGSFSLIPVFLHGIMLFLVSVEKRLQGSSGIFVANLSLVMSFQTAVSFPTMFATNLLSWEISDTFCSFVAILNNLCISLNYFSIFLICAHRFCSMIIKKRIGCLFTKLRCFLYIGTIWLASASYAIFLGVVTYLSKNSPNNECVLSLEEPNLEYSRLISALKFFWSWCPYIGTFYLYCTLILRLYIGEGWLFHRYSLSKHNNLNDETSSALHRILRTRKIIWRSLALIFFCHTPYLCACFINLISGIRVPWTYFVGYIFLFISNLASAVIYGYYNKQFRRALNSRHPRAFRWITSRNNPFEMCWKERQGIRRLDVSMFCQENSSTDLTSHSIKGFKRMRIT